MFLTLPFSDLIIYKILGYLSNLNFDKIVISDLTTEFISKETGLRIRYWREIKVFSIENLGVKYFVLARTLPREYFTQLLNTVEPVGINIVLPDNIRFKYNMPLFIIIDQFPSYYKEAAVSLIFLKKSDIVIEPATKYAGEGYLLVKSFGKINDSTEAIEKTFLEGPGILSVISSGSSDPDYIPWIVGYVKEK